MKYLLDKHFRLRGWYRLPAGLLDIRNKRVVFIDQKLYPVLLQCDGEHEIDEETLSPDRKKFLQQLISEGIIHPPGFLDFLLPEQRYHAYPARYRRTVHWSVTGACNLSCRHCFMSAPHAKHGSPTHEEIIHIIDQLAECGVFNVGMTGGEPLIRTDFPEIVQALAEREIEIGVIFTNGWLLDGKLLDLLEKYGMHPSFQLSFDGIGCHDFLRGTAGAEKRTLEAFKLLKDRGYKTTVSMCLHRGNVHTLRETVRLLASLGVTSMKCGAIIEMGEWTAPWLNELKLTPEEELTIFEKYIPQYFEDDAPLSIMLSGAFMYEKGRDDWGIFYRRNCPPDKEEEVLACPVLRDAFYIGADGMIAPCQGMCDSGFASNLPSLKDTSLSDILSESEYVHLSYATVGDVRRGNTECRNCEFVDRCTGGCRNTALETGDNYYGVDTNACYFFKNGWEDRIQAAAQPAFDAFIKRTPPENKKLHQENSEILCP